MFMSTGDGKKMLVVFFYVFIDILYILKKMPTVLGDSNSFTIVNGCFIF